MFLKNYTSMTPSHLTIARIEQVLIRCGVNAIHQLSLIQMRQADFIQVFLPYVWDGKQTFYQALKASNYKALLGAPK
jgi:hypothetical protein